MTKTDIEEKYFREFLIWCSTAPDGSESKLIFWLDHHFPTVDNFWEWVVKYKAEELQNE